MRCTRVLRTIVFLSLILAVAPFAFAQQNGSISGKVTTGNGEALPGVTVEARSNVLPQPRVTTTNENGDYRFPVLPPGAYTLSFSLSGMAPQTRNVQALLNQDVQSNVRLGMEGVSESITVTADATQLDTTNTEVRSALGSETLEKLPVAQEYRDLIKFTPGVQHTENAVRGPSAGGSGQDNVYLFDGVMVTLPLFGTLSAEPSSHDIQQVSVIKGGARAVDFNRAAGFLIDSVSKSGTSEYKGEVSLQLQSADFTSDVTTGSLARFDEDKTWATLNFGGPILRDRLFFYGSYYRPTVERNNRSNAYGEVPKLDSSRNEYFGKLTFTPTANILLHGSYRDSTRESRGESVASGTAAGSTSQGTDSGLEIGILEGSWITNARSYATFKFTDYSNLGETRPDTVLPQLASISGQGSLNINNLDQMGFFVVPCVTKITASGPCTLANAAPNNAFNTFVTPIIQRYGYLDNGVRVGGGRVGAGAQFDEDNFFRTSYQAGYNYTIGTRVAHDLHIGYQRYTDEEDLTRTSNGWGTITVPGGATSFQGKPIFYTAEFTRMSLADATIPKIHSEYHSQNIEVNDTIRMGNWTFNLGVLASNDTLYGQGLREADTLSGYELAPGHKYEMYDIPFEKMIQPRVGATWAYNGSDTVYASYARYNAAASSLPRAASWDRNSLALIYRVHFDQQGNQIGVESVSSSSGKLFQDDLDPRYTDEYLIGTSQQLWSGFTTRLYGRYRYSTNFWEDTNNNARVQWAPEGYPKDLYIPDLTQRLAQIGSGSTYVIAELDGAFTKYYEATVETEWQRNRAFVRGSYTFSHYYGNFDQDGTTTFNDQNTFIGSSNIGDGPGKQIWDNKYGRLHGDRPHLLKLYGYYSLPWNSTVGAFGLYQSGEAWETWSYLPYRSLPGFGTSTSDTNRYAEPAGRRRADAHYQMDLNYTQNFGILGQNLQFIVDAYNIFDKQTGYNIDPRLSSATYGQAQSFYTPRRFQLAVRMQF